ncbi:hypothetical protein C789_5332 [Microcystis aeruginosa FACHB-905 = DIANCHI905]|uniref:Uncharacterized protein n=1 Tax=Microcystis aeruginosa PCC 7806SL TaxID=1903187 RepID=A0AB33BFJ5_MICA7|nr:hypothetical protein BH695_0744 [Microcystis aeruginosa PCC 7806SL]ELS44878.1 hypothetical protein C789_5332 [Microcystis aeruginosa FACHB-905 = DIANCHI905]
MPYFSLYFQVRRLFLFILLAPISPHPTPHFPTSMHLLHDRNP